jgi:hypothetical protein
VDCASINVLHAVTQREIKGSWRMGTSISAGYLIRELEPTEFSSNRRGCEYVPTAIPSQAIPKSRVPLDKSEGSVKGKDILPVFLHRSFCQRG